MRTIARYEVARMSAQFYDRHGKKLGDPVDLPRDPATEVFLLPDQRPAEAVSWTGHCHDLRPVDPWSWVIHWWRKAWWIIGRRTKQHGVPTPPEPPPGESAGG